MPATSAPGRRVKLQNVIPMFRRGEIKNVASYRAALNQLAQRPDVVGNTALLLYDDAGNLHLQVFKRDEAGVRTLVYDKPFGSVPVPAGVRPGTAPFGNAIEPLILAHLSRRTGVRFRPKRANAPGPDIETFPIAGRETEAEVAVDGLCLQAHRMAQAIRERIRGAASADPLHRPIIVEKARRAGGQWLSRVVRQLERTMGTVPPARIDSLVGCLARVEHATGRVSGPLERLRRSAAARARGIA